MNQIRIRKTLYVRDNVDTGFITITVNVITINVSKFMSIMISLAIVGNLSSNDMRFLVIMFRCISLASCRWYVMIDIMQLNGLYVIAVGLS